jgi:hypothetical protein
MRRLLILILLVAMLGLAACDSTGSDGGVVPTRAVLEQIPTHQFLTQNAPPAGFSTVAFNPIDAQLAAHPGWAYTITGSFSGTFDASGEAASGEFQAVIMANETNETRQVTIQVAGNAMLPPESPEQIELMGVRYGTEYWFVDASGTCTKDSEGQLVVDLGAAQLIGGVTMATPSGHRDTIDGVAAWQYVFGTGDLVLPDVTLKRGANSSITPAADLWVAPEPDAVLVFDLSLLVEDVTLLWAEGPVSGRLDLHYELSLDDLDVKHYIPVPYKCPVT